MNLQWKGPERPILYHMIRFVLLHVTELTTVLRKVLSQKGKGVDTEVPRYIYITRIEREPGKTSGKSHDLF